MRSKTRKSALLCVGLVCVAALLVLAFASAVPAGNGNLGNPGVLPPHSNAFGQTYGEWVAEWWQWAMSFPVDENPMFDPDGRYADQGQSGQVWFLAGAFFTGGEAERSTVIPAGKAIFFPIINLNWVTIYPTDTCGEDPLVWWEANEGWIRELLQTCTDTASDLSCEIDGVALQNLEQYRAYSPEFMVNFPEDNVMNAPAGEQGPGVDVGSYYLMLAPLPVGEHTIHFYGTMSLEAAGMGVVVQDVTWHLTVVPDGE